MAKPNMDPKKNPIPTREPSVRARDFYEVTTGYSEETAINEALRCLSCKNMPCVSGCPVKIHIPEFIQKIKEGKADFGYNARADVYENLFAAGVVDPAKVTRVALENAASIAGMFLTTECVITDKKEENAAPAMAAPGMGGMGGMM